MFWASAFSGGPSFLCRSPGTPGRRETNTTMEQTKKPNALNGITEGVIWKQLVLFAVPILMSNLFQQLYTTMDSVIVGQFVGSQALAAVGSTGSLCGLLVGFFVGLSTGAGVIVSQYYGAEDWDGLHNAVHTAMGISVVAGVILTVVGLVLSPTLLRWINTPDDVFDMAVVYLRIYFGGILSLTIYNMGAGILRAIGDSRRPLNYLIISAVINVALNLLFVCVFHMGVAGVAWATLIAQVVTAVLVMINLMSTTEGYKVTLSHITIHRDTFLKILKIGIPAGFQSVVVSLSNTVIQAQINFFGSDVMAGLSAAGRIDGFIYMPINAFGLAMTTFVGQNVGAGRLDRVRKGVKVCLAMALGIVIAEGALIYVFTEPLLSLISQETAVLQYGGMMVHLMASTYWIFVMAEVLSGVIRGSGEAMVPMVIYICGMCLFRLVWVLVVMKVFETIQSVVWCYPASWSLTALAFIIYYFKGNWLSRHHREIAPQK